MVVALLGEVATRRDGVLVALPGTRSRSLLVALAQHPGRSRSAQGLIDDVWGDDPPRSPMNALHTQISRLRAALPEGALEAGPSGYRLTLAKNQVDLTLARMLEQRAQQHHAEGDHRGSVDAVARARELWRGEAGVDLPDGPVARELATEATARRTALDSVEVAALLALGEYDAALPAGRRRCEEFPLDEQAHLDLMRVLVGAGRDSDALEVFANFRRRIADELGADPSPDLARLNTAILRGETAVRAERPRSPIGLRAAPNVLLGRKADLVAIEDLMRTARVTTVLGPGGTGKTRVANELGARASDRETVVLVELASVRSGSDVASAIASTLGLSEVVVEPGALTRTRVHSIRDRLREAVASRPMVLILDNCEHVVADVADIVADLIAASNKLTVVTTSRAPLMITAEAAYPLPPLAIDDAEAPAVELFRARARAVRPTARLDAAEVARLCRTLDGLPLAIELAAARIRTMSVEEINAGLHDRFSLLRGGDRTSPERHRSLHAVIEWSWNLLDSAERAALRRLCRLPDGFTAATAGAVAGWAPVAGTVTALDGLVNQSMLVVSESASGVRYHQLETVREFGEEQLTASGEADEVLRRMFAWAENFAAGLIADVRTHRQVEVVHRAEAEHDNLLAVLRHAIDGHDARATHTTFVVLGVLWAVRGAHSEVFNWSQQVLDVDPRGPGEIDIPGNFLVVSYLLAGFHLMLAGNNRAIAVARVRLRELLRNRTDIDSATRLQAQLAVSPVSGAGVARILALGARSADEWTRSTALSARSNIRENIADVRGSRRDAEQVMKLAAAQGDTWALTMTCQHIGSIYGQTARYAEAVVYYQRAIDALGDLHAWDEIAQVRGFRAAALVGCGRIAEARTELQELARDTPTFVEWSALGEGNYHLAAITSCLAEADLAEGDIAGGLARYSAALEYSRWPHAGAAPGPFAIMLASAVVCAHVLHGRAETVAAVVGDLAGVALDRLRQFPDLPQLGCAATALGSYLIHIGRDVDCGVELLRLAQRVAARQDYPAMRLDRHVDAARTVVGDVSLAPPRIARSAAAQRILDLAGRLHHG